ncbi:metallophosphoesterase [Paenibacillus agaridevorans]|uniref:metallophosphoesterase n=1 Tax=Paenibacillus agaridevorans TaxID=171404 RepID=UPI001BE4D9F5|nr:metallophosphoesterase [Paenibacillus agaridevorans]
MGVRKKMKAILAASFAIFIASLLSASITFAEDGGEGTEVNVALNKPVTTSDTEPAIPEYRAESAVDGIGGVWANGWSSSSPAGIMPWLQVDLGAEYVVHKVQVHDRPYDGEEGRDSWDGPRTNFEIRASNDPDFDTFIVLGSVGGTPYPGYIWSQEVEEEGAYRYIRYARTNPGYTFLSELSVMILSLPPEWPDGSEATVSGLGTTSLVLNWPAIEDDTATGYVIYRDDVLLGRVDIDANSYDVTGLTPHTEYDFRIEAENEYGLISTNGPTVTETTVYDITVSTTGMAQVIGTDIPNKQLALRMRALEGSLTVHNELGDADVLTVTVRNADPDYVAISEGTMISKGVNSFTFELDVPAAGSVTVHIEPWYYPDPDNFYFIAWSDNQEGPAPFKNKLLPKAELINPVLSVNGGDVTSGTPGAIGGAGNANEFGYPNDYVKDGKYTQYLSLLENYTTPVFEVPGNHDLVRGGWVDRSNARYGMGEAIWNKYLGPTAYSFDVGNTHFMMTNFHYDMPDWTKRWGGNVKDGYLKMGTVGYQTTLPNDDVGEALYNWMDSTFAAAAGKTNKIAVSHHNFNMFVSDGNTVETARNLYSKHDVSYMISGHQHNYQSNVDPVTGIPYLVIGTASHSNPAFALVHVNGSEITHQHMLADNLNLSINYNGANDGTLTTGSATIENSGYDIPFVRLKFRMSNDFAVYEAKDAVTGETIPSFSKRFEDYTVVYVETSIGDGAERNVEVHAVESENPTPPSFTVASTFTDERGKEVRRLVPSASLKANVTISNNGEEAAKATFVVALYNPKGELERIASIERWINGAETFSFSTGFQLPDHVDGYRIKAFAWDDLQSRELWSNEATLEQEV